MQRSAFCRSRRELSNAYLLAKFRFDTAENEPCKVCRDRLERAGLAAAVNGGGPAALGRAHGEEALPRREERLLPARDLGVK